MAARKTSPPDSQATVKKAKAPAAKGLATAKKPEAKPAVKKNATAKKPAARKTAAEKAEVKIALTAQVPQNENNPQTDISERPRSPINGQPIPIGKTFKTREEASEAGKKGGKRSAEIRRARKTLREELLDLLPVTSKNEKGRDVSAQEAISVALLKKAMSGDVRAYETIRDTLGEKFAEKVEMSVALPQFETLDAAFSKMSGGSD